MIVAITYSCLPPGSGALSETRVGHCGYGLMGLLPWGQKVAFGPEKGREVPVGFQVKGISLLCPHTNSAATGPSFPGRKGHNSTGHGEVV